MGRMEELVYRTSQQQTPLIALTSLQSVPNMAALEQVLSG